MPVTPADYPKYMKIGCIVHAPTGDVLSRGHNKRVQENSNIRHGETDALENLGRVREGLLRECIMFTTLSPCIMCSGTCVLYKFPTVVLAENENFVGGEDFLRSQGVEVVNLKDEGITQMMAEWIASEAGRKIWNEDIGEVTQA
ncbi:Cytosine deaminase [Vanrija albida]|uniref:Cytosine deaminase n=1 Tax=Vanrija albida TaxID=181172 RepID=A0ABR3Q526_9TREE